MHESVTNSPSPAANFSKTNLAARDMLMPTSGSRRPQSVGMQKRAYYSRSIPNSLSSSPVVSSAERSARSSATNGNGGAEWDLADDIVNLQISDNGTDTKTHTRTSPQNRGPMGVVGIESSPLETSSETSLGSDSPSPFDHSVNLLTHSRGSSADTTGSSHASGISSTSHTLHVAPYTPLKIAGAGESRNRPHSYSGGLSSADLVRLQQAGGSPNSQEQWYSPNGTPERQAPSEQPTYPSLANQSNFARSHDPQATMTGSRLDDLQVDYQLHSRQFSPLPQGPAMQVGAVPSGPYPPQRANNVANNATYRQRFTPQVPTILQSPPSFGYAAPLHPPPISLNGGQQLYDMMLPTPPLENPAMARLQQQAPYRGGHQHSASDPASLRDPATLALLNSNMQAAFAAGQMYGPSMVPPTIAMFNQFFPEGAYQNPDLNMMGRLQAQYTGPYGVTGQGAQSNGASLNGQSGVTAGSNSSTGPAGNNRKLGLYKTELCRSWEEKGSCRYGSKCQFAHGEEELRQVQRHPKYKTEICRTFWVSGSCPYGKRCCFIHTDLPGAAQPGQDGIPPLSSGEGRPRSDSDPNEIPTSLLSRISAAKRSQVQEQSSNVKSGGASTPPSASLGGRPGSLRVDTSVLDPAAGKQNKSAFPSFAHNGILMPSNDDGPTMSPGPVTAAPDFGRHASARMDIVGTQRIRKNPNVDPNVRHSFNGSEVQLEFSATTPTAANQASQFTMSPEVSAPRVSSRINGHVRSGSAGNWGTATRNHLTAYPLSSIPGGELKNNLPWAETASRRTENNWV
ncbi:hypothetical protein EW026_g355 [Hermanssonia centrifuga]|uniref:C3H1-type domain-containing protein n=1 Tax=Hermanssonia centrifuga TaxID=98765 RepID=A0A4S4KV05_9APHY|nr:hypothetical protein EW026_g355 [Hermanssonia centrifuga]